MGIGDTAGGEGMGLLFGAGGLVLFLYGLGEMRVGSDEGDAADPLVMAERGFDPRRLRVR